MKNGLMDRRDSGVPPWDPIMSLFSRLGGIGCWVDPFLSGKLWEDTLAITPSTPGGVIARFDSPSGSPTLVSLTQETGPKHPILRSDGLEFDGIGDILASPHDAALTFGTSDFTIAAAIKPTATTGLARTVFSKRGNGAVGTNPGWGLRLSSSANANVVLEYDFTGSTTTTYAVSTVGPVVLNSWSNVIIQLDRAAAQATAYVNNVGHSPVTVAVGDITGSKPLMIGGSFTGNTNYFAGIIARGIAINKVLSAADRAIVNDWLSGGRP